VNEGLLSDVWETIPDSPQGPQPRSFQPENQLHERTAAWPVSSFRSRLSGQSKILDKRERRCTAHRMTGFGLAKRLEPWGYMAGLSHDVPIALRL